MNHLPTYIDERKHTRFNIRKSFKPLKWLYSFFSLKIYLYLSFVYDGEFLEVGHMICRINDVKLSTLYAPCDDTGVFLFLYIYLREPKKAITSKISL